MTTTANIFDHAEIIHTYTRAKAIEDGVLVDLMQGDMGASVREAGFRFPLAMTAAAFNECVALTPAAKRACNDERGRLWDVLTTLKFAIRRGTSYTAAGSRSELLFDVYVVRSRVRATRTTLKAVCGPGDNGEPVTTIMFPEED